MSNLMNVKGFAPQTLDEGIKFAELLSKSQLVPKQYYGKPEDILVATQMGYEIGLMPMQSLQNIAVINGRPSVWGDAAMALVQNSPQCEDIEEYLDGDTAVCVAKRKNRKPVTIRFSMEDAKRAGLWGKQGPWTQYPKRMLQMRARGFALRDAFPDVLKGLITTEEAHDIPVDGPPVPVPVEVPEQITVDTSNYLPLHVPGVEEPYSMVADIEQWITEYAKIVRKVMTSSKFDEEQKLNKLANLWEVNAELVDSVEAIHKIKLRAAIADAGGDPLAILHVEQGVEE